MNAWSSLFTALILVLALVVISFFGVGTIGLSTLFGVVIPYVAMAIFVIGFVYRIVRWAMVPVPFRIPTTCGQGKSLPWIKADNLESPYNTWGLIARMALEVLLFRSLFRNTKAELRDGPTVTYGSAKWLWLAGILFHYSFLTIIIRHLRFFIEPVPSFVVLLSSVDGFFQILVPTFFLTDIAFLAAATYLFLRRVAIPQIRYISLVADYFPLFLILGIAVSGVLMRNVWKVDLLGVKELAMGLFTFHPTVPAGIGPIFYVHLFLVSVLLVYFPFSKLMHAGGVFLSPTRNMLNNNRSERYINPWNYPVKVHTYEEYEDDFRAKMKEAGIPVDKE
ncbi:MAG: sulfate reduction electron transfer complex DsrMKJOP subunit DsrM [Deltaproteobacteria bacterium]|nr:sulfate reduction electron transfer complex DsrMKJOP subunit DsrM [Deltaproteobacteria bacterium]